MATTLTHEQEAFLEECALEFSDRFTDADLEYKKIYDSGIPNPPIMCPWYRRGRFNRDRGEDRRGEDRHGERRERDYRSEDNRDRNSQYNNYRERRYRPY